jgi:hypothetical protein
MEIEKDSKTPVQEKYGAAAREARKERQSRGQQSTGFEKYSGVCGEMIPATK